MRALLAIFILSFCAPAFGFHCESIDIVKVTIDGKVDKEHGALAGEILISIEGTAFFLERSQIHGFWNQTVDHVHDFRILSHSEDSDHVWLETKNGVGFLDMVFKGVRFDKRRVVCEF